MAKRPVKGAKALLGGTMLGVAVHSIEFVTCESRRGADPDVIGDHPVKLAIDYLESLRTPAARVHARQLSPYVGVPRGKQLVVSFEKPSRKR